MALVLMTRIAILVVIFFGGLFSIIAVAGKEWRKAKNSQGKTTFGLWEVCGPLLPNTCTTYKVSDFDDAKLEG